MASGVRLEPAATSSARVVQLWQVVLERSQLSHARLLLFYTGLKVVSSEGKIVPNQRLKDYKERARISCTGCVSDSSIETIREK